MTLPRLTATAFSTLLVFVAVTSRAAGTGAPSLYAEHCASCHGAGRLGGIGPALLPENLGRLKRDEAIAIIRDGRVATQMPGYRDKLSTEQITQLAGLIYAPLPQVPRWDMADVRGSHVVHVKPGGKLSDKPVFKADPLNLFVVVEVGDHHATLLDGDRFEPRVFPRV